MPLIKFYYFLYKINFYFINFLLILKLIKIKLKKIKNIKIKLFKKIITIKTNPGFDVAAAKAK